MTTLNTKESTSQATITLAAVQPKTYFGDDEKAVNLLRAEAYVKEAAQKNADIVCFPESYPGPWTEGKRYSIREEVSGLAAKYKVYLICGDLEEASGGFYNIFRLFDRSGKEIGIYRRTTPDGPWIYGERPWGFPYVAGDSLPVFDTEFGKIGIIMCSEVFVPELSRALALQGAEIIFMPAGITPNIFFETWGTLAKARAYENLSVTVVVKNILHDEDGFCMITGPEGPLLASDKPGVHIATVDLERLRWLRATEDGYFDELPFRVKPGLLSQWRVRRDVFKQYL